MSVRMGAMFESLFASEAMRRGLDVATPSGHHLPFDLIVSNRDGKLFRVQVKGTSCDQGAGAYKFTTRRGGNNLKRVNYKIEIDVLVGIVEKPGERIFYIIPNNVLGTQKQLKVRPSVASRAKYEKFREAWEIFDQ